MSEIPWPIEDASPVTFIVDAANSVEQRLLNEWLDQQTQTATYAGNISRIVISLTRDPDNIESHALAALNNLPDNTLLVPVGLVWQSNTGRDKKPPRLRNFLLREPAFPTQRQAEKILKSDPDRALRIVAEPASIGELKKDLDQKDGASAEADQFASFVARRAALALDGASRRFRGSRYKVPFRVPETIKASKLFRDGLQNLSEESGRSNEDLLKETDLIMKEMVAKPKPFWIDMAGSVTRKITSMAYEAEIVVDQEEVERIRDMVANHPSAFLWTHKTHIDGIAIQQIMYENHFPSAHTFGGLNMAFAGVGAISRRSGIIFIRRTFQDNPLYKMILRHYIGFLLEKRFPFSWAFEGTRSRVGKLMPPRFGLLRYLLEAAHTTGSENLHIIPVAINYDLIGDVADYAKEQSGEKKRPESLSWFLGYLRGQREPMGRIYMDFGKPVVIEQAPHPDDRLALSKIAFQVGVEVNRVTPITITSLATMVLLSASPRALTNTELASQVSELMQWAQKRGIRVSSDFDANNAEQAQAIVRVLIANDVITLHDEASVELYAVAPDQHAVACYYRNTTVHHFITKAFAEVALLAVSTAESNLLDTFWEEAEALRDLFKFEFFYPSRKEFRDQLDAELTMFDPDWQPQLATSPDYARKLLRSMTPLVSHAALLQFAEAYWIVAAVLNRIEPDATLEESDLVADALVYGRQAYLQRRIRSRASIGKQLFKNGFKLVDNFGLTAAGDANGAEKRMAFSQDLDKLMNRLERLRARALPL